MFTVKAEGMLLALAFVLESCIWLDEPLEEFLKVSSKASGHSEGGLHLSQDEPNKIAPLPSVHLSVHAC